MYPLSWASNPDDLDDKTGEATFIVEGVLHKFRLCSFLDAMRLNDMLEDVFVQGRTFGAETVLDAVKTAGENRLRQLGS